MSTDLDEAAYMIELVANLMSSAGKKRMAITTSLLADVLSMRIFSLKVYLV